MLSSKMYFATLNALVSLAAALLEEQFDIDFVSIK